MEERVINVYMANMGRTASKPVQPIVQVTYVDGKQALAMTVKEISRAKHVKNAGLVITGAPAMSNVLYFAPILPVTKIPASV